MRDEQQRAVERLHRLFDPLAAGKVEVVGRLVQNEEIQGVVHQLAQAQAAFFAAGQHIDRFHLRFARELERAQPVARDLHGHVLVIDQRVDQVAVRVGEMHLLRQIGRLQAHALADRTLVRRFLPQQDPEQGGLARAVCAQQGDLLAVADVEADTV